MSSQLIASQREKAVVFTGKGVCKQKAMELFEKYGLPNGVFYLDDVVELGFNESTGFMWHKRPKKTEQVHHKLGNKGSFDVEVTMFLEERAITKIKGFKVKEMMLWLPVGSARVEGPSNDKITMTGVGGISRSFSFSMFVFEN